MDKNWIHRSKSYSVEHSFKIAVVTCSLSFLSSVFMEEFKCVNPVTERNCLPRGLWHVTDYRMIWKWRTNLDDAKLLNSWARGGQYLCLIGKGVWRSGEGRGGAGHITKLRELPNLHTTLPMSNYRLVSGCHVWLNVTAGVGALCEVNTLLIAKHLLKFGRVEGPTSSV